MVFHGLGKRCSSSDPSAVGLRYRGPDGAVYGVEKHPFPSTNPRVQRPFSPLVGGSLSLKTLHLPERGPLALPRGVVPISWRLSLLSPSCDPPPACASAHATAASAPSEIREGSGSAARGACGRRCTIGASEGRLSFPWSGWPSGCWLRSFQSGSVANSLV